MAQKAQRRNQKISDEELVKVYFDMFDENKDGKIAKTELKDLLFVLCNMTADDKYIDRELAKYDVDQNGTIEYNELLEMYRHMENRHEEKSLYELFKEIDADNNDTINEEEVKQFLRVIDVPVKDDAVKKIMKESDTDNNGEISLKEFCLMCRKYNVVGPNKTQ